MICYSVVGEGCFLWYVRAAKRQCLHKRAGAVFYFLVVKLTYSYGNLQRNGDAILRIAANTLFCYRKSLLFTVF